MYERNGGLGEYCSPVCISIVVVQWLESKLATIRRYAGCRLAVRVSVHHSVDSDKQATVMHKIQITNGPLH